MRKVVFGGAISLDNFIARKDETVEWIKWSPEAAELMKEYWETIDTFVMGRKTHDFARRNSESGKSLYMEMKAYVFSRNLAAGLDGDAEIVNKDAVEFVRDLKEQNGKDISVMGGGDFARTLFEAKLIDELRFNIHPVLLGSGIPLFYEMSQQIDLELIEGKALKNGCVYVSYRVTY